MATARMTRVIQHLREADAGLSDGQLLGSFISRCDEAAFAALVRRHGPMVWGVCRRVLGRHHDAEDAFQATFLVLVRKASSITSRALLANYLYGVAHRTALKARTAALRRQARERQVESMPEPATPPELAPEMEPLLDEELARLPDKYRVPIVLCDLEGKTRKAAARQLGWPEGTVAGRLARGRTLLAKRLTRRGLALSGGALATILARNAATACVPAAVTAATVNAAGLFAAGKSAAPALLSAKVASLTQGVLKAMLMTKIKAALAVFLLVGLVVLGSGIGYRTLAADKGPAPEGKDNKLRDTILVLDKMWWEAATKHDVDTLDKLMADNFVGLGGNGHRWTKATMLEQHRDYRNYDLKVLSEREVFRVNEHTAILTYETKFSAMTKAGAPAGSAHQRLMSCWVQRDGGWFVAFLQYVNVPDAVAPAKAPVTIQEPLDLKLLNPYDPNIVPWPPPEVKLDPSIYPSGPVQLDPSQFGPLDPGKCYDPNPGKFYDLNPGWFQDLTVQPPPKPPEEPKGTGKGPGNPNADKGARKL